MRNYREKHYHGNFFDAEWCELEKNVDKQMCDLKALSMTCYSISDWVYYYCSWNKTSWWD